MDTAPFAINSSSSVRRCYGFFRTMGLRHLIVLDDGHKVAGIVTRSDITEHRLEHHWFQEGDNMQKFINVDPMDPLSGPSTHEDSTLLGPSQDKYEGSTFHMQMSDISAGDSERSSAMRPDSISSEHPSDLVVSPIQQKQQIQSPVEPPPAARPPPPPRGGKAEKEPKSVKSSK